MDVSCGSPLLCQMSFSPWSAVGSGLGCPSMPGANFWGSFFFLLAVVLQEEVVAGDCQSSHQDDELGKVDLTVVVGVQVPHHLVYGLLILSILQVPGQKEKNLLHLGWGWGVLFCFSQKTQLDLTPK